ncbi:hypothetical protein K488DRAFT_76756 [Vararia minispora EC-137]|uniref:Uncharacterized protein n=1 Tax=Vararia minispora EC-137 TaxID=1314806 RepID=A0ACB8QU12_9AGAM|nr:hypothetical protein K488DRAFT_76756 [Vararia minispora EC-137]
MGFFRRSDRNAPHYAPPPGPPPPSSRARYAPPPGLPPGRIPSYSPPPDPPPKPKRSAAPPRWAPAPEISEASEQDFEAGVAFCDAYPLDQPKLISSAAVERIHERGCGAWGLVKPAHHHFSGLVNGDNKSGLAGSWRVVTDKTCKDSCITSDLPVVGALYEHRGKRGIYFEVRINKMEGTIAVGTACKPYPEFRLPGWNRQSAGFHLDDMRKFFEDADGGRDYAPHLSVHPGCTVGCGYDFSTGVIFFTFNGERLPDAFRGLYLPRSACDVYAAIGVEGVNDLEVNFGTATFIWKEGNEWAWRVEGHVGQTIAGTSYLGEELPAYSKHG